VITKTDSTIQQEQKKIKLRRVCMEIKPSKTKNKQNKKQPKKPTHLADFQSADAEVLVLELKNFLFLGV